MGKGDVIIGIDLKVDGLKESREVQKTFTELTKDVKSTDTELSSLDKDGQKCVKTLDEIRRKSSRGIATKEYLDLRDIVNGLDADTKKYAAELDTLNEKLSKTDPNKNADKYQKLQDEIAKTSAKLKQARSDYAEYKAFFEEFAKTTEAYKPFKPEQVEQWSGEAEKAVNKLKDVNTQIKKIQDTREQAAKDNKIAEDFISAKKRAEELQFKLWDLIGILERASSSTYKVYSAFKKMKEEGAEFPKFDEAEFAPFYDFYEKTKRSKGMLKDSVFRELKTELDALKGSIPDEEFETLSNAFRRLKSDASDATLFVQELYEDIGHSNKLVAPIDELVSKFGLLKELEAQRTKYSDSEIASGGKAELQLNIQRTNTIRELQAALSEFINLKNIDIQTNEADAQSILQMERELEKLKVTRDMYKSNTMPSEDESAEYTRTIFKIAELEQAIKQYYDTLHDVVKNGGKEISENVQPVNQLATTIRTALVTAAEKAKKSLDSLGDSLKKSVGSLFSKLSSSLKSVASNFRKSSSGADELNKKLKHGWTAIMKYVLGFRSLFFLVRKLRGAVKEGLENLVQFEGGANETNKQITALQSSLLFLKNAWAAAFAPIINVVVPILNVIIDKIAQLGNLIASFIAALTGQATVIHAVKTEVEDYAKSLDKSAGSSGKASKAADKLHDRLAAFDDLNVLGKDDETDPNKSGGGGGSLDPNIPNINDMFKRVLTQSNFAKMIKDAMEDWDFSAVGDLVSQKFVNMINKINWGDIKEKMSKGIKGITTFINGALTNPQLFTSIGYNLAQGFNTVFTGLKEFIDGIDWYNIFHNVGTGINTFISTLDFGSISGLVTSGVNAIVLAFSGLKDSIDFSGFAGRLKNFGSSILQTWTDINNSGIFTDFGSNVATLLSTAFDSIPLTDIETALNNLVTSICDFIDGVLSDEDLMNSIGEFIAGAFNSAANVIDTFIGKAPLSKLTGGFATVLTSAIVGLKISTLLGSIKTLVLKVIKAIGNFFKTANWSAIGESIGDIIAKIILWLSSPENVIKITVALVGLIFGILKSLATLIVSAISGLIGGLGNTIGESLADGLLEFDVVGWIQDSIINAAEAWNEGDILEAGKQLALGLLKGVAAPFIAIGEWLKIHVVTPFVDAIKELFGIASPSKVMEEIGGFLVDGLFNGLSTLVETVTQPFIDLKDAIVEKLDTLKTKATEKVTALKLKLYLIAVKIKDLVTTPFTDIKDTIIETVTSMKTKVVALWRAIWAGIKGVINKILGGIESFCNGIIDGINSLLSLLDVVDDLPDAVKEYVGLDDFTIPQLEHIEIPRLAQGAVIPPNKEFLAVLGDQKQGTNIEAPLDTIVDAFREVMGNLQIENTGTAVMQVDGQTFARLMTPYVVSELGRRGYDVKIIGG